MVTGLHRPHFGDIITKRFHKVINLRTGGTISCGGLISVIAHSFLEQFPPGYTFFQTESSRLNLQNLRAMNMLRTSPDPISDTMWVLPSNIPPPPRPRRAQQVRQPQSDQPSSSTQHPDYADATPVSFSQPDPMHTDF
ncbi:unnamed protein product [Lactuca saligna]|uniref:Uncharacterized protein n=1 Tax=Lactuca saligna TaxID=75948 RepID=A0AA35VGF4_LACSI|nr:unnamed protein product [Lactuca saligna]